MQTIFDSKTLPAAKRRQAWQDAICQIYLQVDCAAEQQDDYEGFVRELRFGAMTLTDTLSSPQSVLRQSRHIARLEKDCYFLGLAQSGCVEIRQAASSMTMHAGAGALYCASEPYALRCDIKLRSFWAELPRQAFASRFDSEAPPLIARLNLSRGLGRIAVEFSPRWPSKETNWTRSPEPSSANNSWISRLWRLARILAGNPRRRSASGALG